MKQPDSDHLGKGSAANSKAFDETAYLLSSKANAHRLLKSIANLRAGKLTTLKETPIL
ncbi:hypothetical protein [Pseudomonas silesiensis]|jgi:PHD/YefM family antitoxin component YafN of YafNO toxin-antitoxin module|uniref:hypothetical protein n=1 Tax=Pseudomonas silesiensis TaxID=1853130 RepID=UPI00137481F8|nr:hypothetical protein [Pseudomonas silesiensis]